MKTASIILSCDVVLLIVAIVLGITPRDIPVQIAPVIFTVVTFANAIALYKFIHSGDAD